MMPNQNLDTVLVKSIMCFSPRSLVFPYLCAGLYTIIYYFIIIIIPPEVGITRKQPMCFCTCGECTDVYLYNIYICIYEHPSKPISKNVV